MTSDDQRCPASHLEISHLIQGTPHLRTFLFSRAKELQPEGAIIAEYHRVPRLRKEAQFVAPPTWDASHTGLEGISVHARRRHIRLKCSVVDSPMPLQEGRDKPAHGEELNRETGRLAVGGRYHGLLLRAKRISSTQHRGSILFTLHRPELDPVCSCMN